MQIPELSQLSGLANNWSKWCIPWNFLPVSYFVWSFKNFCNFVWSVVFGELRTIQLYCLNSSFSSFFFRILVFQASFAVEECAWSIIWIYSFSAFWLQMLNIVVGYQMNFLFLEFKFQCWVLKFLLKHLQHILQH